MRKKLSLILLMLVVVLCCNVATSEAAFGISVNLERFKQMPDGTYEYVGNFSFIEKGSNDGILCTITDMQSEIGYSTFVVRSVQIWNRNSQYIYIPELFLDAENYFDVNGVFYNPSTATHPSPLSNNKILMKSGVTYYAFTPDSLQNIQNFELAYFPASLTYPTWGTVERVESIGYQNSNGAFFITPKAGGWQQSIRISFAVGESSVDGYYNQWGQFAKHGGMPSGVTVRQLPKLQPIGNKSAQAGQLLQFEVTGIVPNGAVLSYSASNLPTGATFDPVTHIFSWIPSIEQVGNYPNVLFTVTDNGTPKASAYEAITITVNNVNRPPVINAIGNKTVNEGDTLSFAVSGSDPDGNALAYSASNLPAGATFDPATQTFSWTPSFGQAGNYSAVLFTVTDNGTPIANASEAITITVNNVNRPPVMSPIGNKTVSESQTIAFTVTASDPDGDTITYSAANLPAGATFDPAAQTFIWTPTFDQSGEFANIEFTATDNGSPMELATQLITISVNNVNRSPVFAPVGSQQTLEGKTVQFLVSASDPDGNAITYSASALPTGAVFEANHNFVWTPDYTQAENYTITFYAADDGAPNMTAQMDVSISVGVPAPSDIVNVVISTITGMGLPKNMENSYMANLKKVNIFIAGNKFTPAINELNAFIGKVNDDILNGKISAADGNNLVAMANAVINILQP